MSGAARPCAGSKGGNPGQGFEGRHALTQAEVQEADLEPLVRGMLLATYNRALHAVFWHRPFGAASEFLRLAPDLAPLGQTGRRDGGTQVGNSCLFTSVVRFRPPAATDLRTVGDWL